MAEAKLVSEDTEYEVEMTIKYKQKQTVNPNGRGYEADNVTHTFVGTALDVSFPAKSIDSLIKRTMAHLNTLKDED
ncbi:hypothetical protein [Nocardia phage P3.1]|nr:hypothetical protein [Nocardia phage P3.1]